MPDELEQPSRRIVSTKLTLPTVEDIQLGSTIAPEACPRRYCFWWKSHLFDWEIPPSQGCAFLLSGKPPGWMLPNVPCCRADPLSPIDHFEPNEPNLEQDEVDLSKWIVVCDKSRDRIMSKLQLQSRSSSANDGV